MFTNFFFFGHRDLTRRHAQRDYQLGDIFLTDLINTERLGTSRKKDASVKLIYRKASLHWHILKRFSSRPLISHVPGLISSASQL